MLQRGSEHLGSQVEQGKDQVSSGLDLSDDSKNPVVLPHTPAGNKNSYFLLKPSGICTLEENDRARTL